MVSTAGVILAGLATLTRKSNRSSGTGTLAVEGSIVLEARKDEGASEIDAPDRRQSRRTLSLCCMLLTRKGSSQRALQVTERRMQRPAQPVSRGQATDAREATAATEPVAAAAAQLADECTDSSSAVGTAKFPSRCARHTDTAAAAPHEDRKRDAAESELRGHSPFSLDRALNSVDLPTG